MPRKYTHVQEIAEEVFKRKAEGQTNREIGEMYGLTKKQIKQLVSRENRKARRIEAGYVPQPKGRPRKSVVTEELKQQNEIVLLRIPIDARSCKQHRSHLFATTERKF